jgi:hypothetical protein
MHQAIGIYCSYSFFPLMKLSHILSGVALLCLLATSSVSAATFRAGDTIALTVPVQGDLYVAGDTVTIDQTVEGDLIVGGGTVTIRGTVLQDVLIGGGTVAIRGTVQDDVRAAGGKVIIAGNILGDLIVAGGEVILDQNASVSGDVVAFGGTITLHGVTVNNVRTSGGDILIEGRVGGNVIAEGGTIHIDAPISGFSKVVGDTITLGSAAQFGKNVQYWTKSGPMDFGPALAAGAEATFSPELRTMGDIGKRNGKLSGLLAGVGIFSILSGALLILLLLLVTKNTFTDITKKIIAQPWWNVLYGFLYVIAVPVIAVLFMITVIGLPIGLFILFYYVFAFWFIGPVSAIVIAKWIQMTYKKKWGLAVFFFVCVGVLILLKVLWMVPLIGWIIKLLVTFATFGALMMTKHEKWKKIA